MAVCILLCDAKPSFVIIFVQGISSSNLREKEGRDVKKKEVGGVFVSKGRISSEQLVPLIIIINL